MKIIKLSTGPWALTQAQFNYYTPNNDGIVNGYKFEVNNDCDNCDFWVVRGDIQKRIEFVNCPPDNIIFLQDEVYDERDYKPDFLSQFSAVIGPKKEIKHRKYIFNHEMMPWLFKNKSYNELSTNIDSHLKSQNICLMTSDAVWIKGHKTRFAFSNKLIGHFKDQIDVYGRGFNEFDCKFDVLKKYKYCIALENTVYPGYFTEKINECFLSEAFPVYYGCPDIDDYYSRDSLIRIEAENLRGSIDSIEKMLESDSYQTRLTEIRAMKTRYLEKYHLPNRLTDLLQKNFKQNSKKRKTKILSESFYYDFSQGIHHLILGAKILATRSISKISSITRLS